MKKGSVISVLIVIVLLTISLTGCFSDNNNGEEKKFYIETLTFGLTDIEISTNEDITDIEIQNGIAWIGTQKGFNNQGGLYKYNIESNDLTKLNRTNGLLSDNINTLALDDDDLWIGTDHGISIYTISSSTWRNLTQKDGLAGNDIRDIIIENDKVWIASFGLWQYLLRQNVEGGISSYNKYSGVITAYNSSMGYLLDDAIFTIAKKDNIIWIGGKKGLKLFNISDIKTYLWEEESLEWTNKTSHDPLSTPPQTYRKNIYRIKNFNEDMIIGSQYNFDVEIYNMSNRIWTTLLENTPIRDIEIYDNNIFLATENGVRIYNNDFEKWQILGEANGLLENSITSLEISNDQLWIGSIDGINVYDIVIERTQIK